jgi:hypothetical protein
MPITITFLSSDGKPLPEGTPLEILGDGSVLASTKISQDGKATFDVDAGKFPKVSVRVAI